MQKTTTTNKQTNTHTHTHTELNEYIYDFSVDHSIIDTSNIISIHKHWMKKHGKK